MIEDKYYKDEKFFCEDYTQDGFVSGDFENCVFDRCNFTSLVFNSQKFSNCQFEFCNFSMAELNDVGLHSVVFRECKLTGVNFGQCSGFLFSPSFEKCDMNYTSFSQKKMKNIAFSECSLRDSNFADLDLSGAVFSECDLFRTLFVRCNLRSADFVTAFNYSFDPEVNKISKAKFSMPAVVGLLAKYSIVVKY